MAEQFVSESIKPVQGVMDMKSMAIGEPGLPARFVWRDREYIVMDVLDKWRETGPCKRSSGPGGEQYVRKHWFLIRVDTGQRMKLYFERQPKPGRSRTARWWLFTVEDEG